MQWHPHSEDKCSVDISNFTLISGKSLTYSLDLDLKEVTGTPWIPASFLTQQFPPDNSKGTWF